MVSTFTSIHCIQIQVSCSFQNKVTAKIPIFSQNITYTGKTVDQN